MFHTWTRLYVILEKQDKQMALKFGRAWETKKKKRKREINVQRFNLPEERSFLQQSEKPLKAAKWRGNIPCMPRLE